MHSTTLGSGGQPSPLAEEFKSALQSFRGSVPGIACCLLLAHGTVAMGNDDDGTPTSSGTPTLSAEQQHAVGIVVARPVAAWAPETTLTLGLVLDATLLIADVGEASTTAVADHAAAAEVARLVQLYKGEGSSLRVLEAAQAERARAHAQAELAAARFSLNWGPLAALPASRRQKILDALTSGHDLLLRADLPGRHSVGALPSKALLKVDGIQVPGNVLGVLRAGAESQGVGLLVDVSNAPNGLGPGARLPVELFTARHAGRLVPRDAVFYDENGPYVFKQLSKKKTADPARYAPLKVTLLVAVGNGWLVDGVDDDDDIVVHGAGILWSLQGADSHAIDDDD